MANRKDGPVKTFLATVLIGNRTRSLSLRSNALLFRHKTSLPVTFEKERVIHLHLEEKRCISVLAPSNLLFAFLPGLNNRSVEEEDGERFKDDERRNGVPFHDG